MCDVDLCPVPAQHLASLASLTRYLRIWNVSGYDLVSQSLGRDETRRHGGQGLCRELTPSNPNEVEDRYREELRTWANDSNWRIYQDTLRYLRLLSS